MNFISTFDELNKLYEEAETIKKVAFMDFTGSSESFKDAYEKRIKADGFEGEVKSVNDTQMKALCDAVNAGNDVTLYTCDDDYKTNCKSIVGKKNFKVVTVVKESVEEACTKEELTEAAEDAEIEIVADEMPVEEAPVEDIPEDAPVEAEPRQLVLECDKCGAIVVISEDKVVIDEESDLANIEDECKFCEETKGYKIIGSMIPYETTEEPAEELPEDEPAEVEIAEDEELEELFDANVTLDARGFGGSGNDVSVL